MLSALTIGHVHTFRVSKRATSNDNPNQGLPELNQVLGPLSSFLTSAERGCRSGGGFLASKRRGALWAWDWSLRLFEVFP